MSKKEKILLGKAIVFSLIGIIFFLYLLIPNSAEKLMNFYTQFKYWVNEVDELFKFAAIVAFLKYLHDSNKKVTISLIMDNGEEVSIRIYKKDEEDRGFIITSMCVAAGKNSLSHSEKERLSQKVGKWFEKL